MSRVNQTVSCIFTFNRKTAAGCRIHSDARGSISDRTNTELLKIKENIPCFKRNQVFVKRISGKIIAENVRDDRLRRFCSLYRIPVGYRFGIDLRGTR